MKVYNQDKTQILDDFDLAKGYLTEDTIKVHYDEIKAVEEQWHYETIKEYPNGREVKKVIDVPKVVGIPAHDEIENIYVYIPFTKTELTERHKNELREKRKPLLNAFDKWEKAVLRNREKDDIIVMQWFEDLLDLKESAFETVPERINYYL